MVNLAELRIEQLKLSKKVILIDSFSTYPKTIAGCDICYTNKKMIAVIAVCDAKNLTLIETKYTIADIRFPYIPDFESYREAAPIIETYHKLETHPDIMLVEGNGILHPRKLGIASHIGILLDKPVIGITKKMTFGETVGNSIYIQKEAVGRILDSKEKAKPIFVSPGHKISLTTAVEIVKETLIGHKLPEPMHLAHKFATKLKQKIGKD